jgi:hypothetical protein
MCLHLGRRFVSTATKQCHPTRARQPKQNKTQIAHPLHARTLDFLRDDFARDGWAYRLLKVRSTDFTDRANGGTGEFLGTPDEQDMDGFVDEPFEISVGTIFV